MASANNGPLAAVVKGIHPHNLKQYIKEKEQHQYIVAESGTSIPMSASDYVLAGVRDAHELCMLSEYAVNYAHSIGLVGRSSDKQYKYYNDVSVAPPLALLPSPFPLELYEQAIEAQQAMSELYFRIACDYDFLIEAYKDVIKSDPFHAKLIELAKRLHREGIKQPLMLEVQRADYLVHWDAEEKKMELIQVEVNPGTIGGPGSSTGVSKLHAKMLAKLEIVHGKALSAIAGENAVVPVNRVRQGMALAIYNAWKLFGDPNAIILYVNQPDLFPVCALEQLQFVQFEVEKLAKQGGQRVLVRQLNFVECGDRLSLDENDHSLYDGEKRIGLVHLAYGYLPEHYPTEKSFQARVLMERSCAILSPNLNLQLAGTKKIQQILSKPGVLEHFFPDEPQKVAIIRNTYTELWGLENDDEPTRAVIQKAIQNNKDFVMKCQQGGGHGIYFDDEMAEMLKRMSLEERGSFILQKKINPIAVKNYMVRPFQPTAQLPEDVNSELGIFGSLIGDQCTRTVLVNTVNGHLLRSKASSQKMGGVCCGGGVIDSPFLFPSSKFQHSD